MGAYLSCASSWKLVTLVKVSIKAKKNRLCIRIQSMTIAKTICWIHTQKRKEADKMETKMVKRCMN